MAVQQLHAVKAETKPVFGSLIVSWKGGVKPKKILEHLPGWNYDTLRRLEQGTIAPAFHQLRVLFRALLLAGVAIPSDGPQLFVLKARKRIENKGTHRDTHTDEEWAVLCDDLEQTFQEFGINRLSPTQLNSSPLLLDTSHLIRRDQWHEQVRREIVGSERKKVIVVVGPSGIGKSSELNRFALTLRRTNSHRPILCDFRAVDRVLSPEEALHVCVGTMLSALGFAQAQEHLLLSAEEQVVALLEQTAKSHLPVVMILDHAECILNEQGKLATCWERFLSSVLKYQHQCTLLLALKQWPTWFVGDMHFLIELPLPALTQDQTILLLQQLGLKSVPSPLLQQMYEKVGGVPLCLEWLATLVKHPVGYYGEQLVFGTLSEEKTSTASDMTKEVSRLLSGPNIFTDTLGEEIITILDQTLANYHLSEEAYRLLRVLSLSPLPLPNTALAKVSTQWSRGVRELRRASLLVTYPERVRVLPSIAAAVVHRLSPEERQTSERILQSALRAWLVEGMFYENEKGQLVAELATLLLRHSQLLSAAELFIKYGWLAFHLGYAVSLSQKARTAVEEWSQRAFEEPRDESQECGSWLLHYFLYPYLGEKIDAEKRARDYTTLLERRISSHVCLEPTTELFVVRHLMFFAMNRERYAEAEEILHACELRIADSIEADSELQASFLEKQGFLFTNWCEYAEEKNDAQLSQQMRERVVSVYLRSIAILETAESKTTPLKSGILKKRLARALTNLGFHLSRMNRFEQAIEMLRRSVVLKEQGFTEPGSLAASYGDLSQALAGAGYLEEALRYDELAMESIEQLAKTGDTISQETVWNYRVNRGKLYAKLGRDNEAEHMLLEAQEHIHERWRMYRMFAQQTLDELALRRTSVLQRSSRPQYDERWIATYRDLISFDSLGMLTATRFDRFSNEEKTWQSLVARRDEPTVQRQMETLLANGKQRELLAALQEQRDPVFSYPNIPVEEVRQRRTDLQALQDQIGKEEKNEVVRTLYIGDQRRGVQGAIPYHLHLLQLLEATAIGNSDVFWVHGNSIYPVPTAQEMVYALSRVKWFVAQGRQHSSTRYLSHQLDEFFQKRLLLSLYDVPSTEDLQMGIPLDVSLYGKPVSTTAQHDVSPEKVKTLFSALFRDQNCVGWEAQIDFAAQNTRIEPGLRKYILAGVPYSFTKVIEQVAHEWGAHIAPRVAGEHSPLGILGIGTGRSLTTEEGLGYYLEWELAKRTGQRFDEAKIWLGTLATGLAAGVLTSPQTFLSLYHFFELFFLLYRLIWRGDEEIATARSRASILARTRCLRTFRGVPSQARSGICFTKDAVYERGFFQVYNAVVNDPKVLYWLASGVISLDEIQYLQALGMSPASHSPKEVLERPDLQSYILSLEGGEKGITTRIA